MHEQPRRSENRVDRPKICIKNRYCTHFTCLLWIFLPDPSAYLWCRISETLSRKGPSARSAITNIAILMRGIWKLEIDGGWRQVNEHGPKLTAEWADGGPRDIINLPSEDLVPK